MGLFLDVELILILNVIALEGVLFNAPVQLDRSVVEFLEFVTLEFLLEIVLLEFLLN